MPEINKNDGVTEFVTNSQTFQSIQQKIADCADVFAIPDERKSAFVSELNHLLEDLLLENSEWQRINRELNYSREHYRCCFDQSPIACCCFDPQGILIESNLAAAQLLNVSRNCLCGNEYSFLTHLPENGYKAFYQHIEAVLDNAEHSVCTLEVVPLQAEHPIRVELKSFRAQQRTGDWQCISFVQKL